MSKGTTVKRLSAAVALAVLAAAGAPAGAASTAAMEKQIQQLQDQLNALRSELQAVKSAEPAQTQQVQQLDTRVSKVETDTAAPVKQLDDRVAKVENWVQSQPPKVAGNMIFFRGGYAGLTESRANSVFSDLYGPSLGLPANSNDSGWYAGGGFDFLLSRDTWGILPGTWALAELSAEFSNVDSKDTVLTVPTAACALAKGVSGLGAIAASGCAVTGTNNLTQLTVSASPKIKFMEGSRFRPWIIPVGLDFRVISPPSESSAYLDVGAQFAGGAEYELIPGIKLGADFRYHLAAGLTNPGYSAATVAALGFKPKEPDNDYWTAGGYLGIGF